MSTVQKERGKRTLRIFLSYTEADRTQAHKLRSLLSQRPKSRVFTTEMLSAGEDWESELRNEISQCDIFVVLVSPNSVHSEWVLHELGAAWALSKPIIPVVTHPEVFSEIPLELREVQSVEIKDLEKPGAMSQILEHYEGLATSHNSG